jgi:hypothetical protein
MSLGAKHVENPFITFGLVTTIAYFFYFLLIKPLVAFFENSTVKVSKIYNISKLNNKI